MVTSRNKQFFKIFLSILQLIALVHLPHSHKYEKAYNWSHVLCIQGQDGSKGDKGSLGLPGNPGEPGLRGKDVSKS